MEQAANKLLKCSWRNYFGLCGMGIRYLDFTVFTQLPFLLSKNKAKQLEVECESNRSVFDYFLAAWYTEKGLVIPQRNTSEAGFKDRNPCIYLPFCRIYKISHLDAHCPIKWFLIWLWAFSWRQLFLNHVVRLLIGFLSKGEDCLKFGSCWVKFSDVGFLTVGIFNQLMGTGNLQRCMKPASYLFHSLFSPCVPFTNISLVSITNYKRLCSILLVVKFLTF